MIFLLLAWTGAVLTLPAQTGRPVSAELKGVPLSAALKKLEQASGCSILFTYSDVQPYRVTASIRDMAVEQAVKKLLEGKPLTSVRRGGGVSHRPAGQCTQAAGCRAGQGDRRGGPSAPVQQRAAAYARFGVCERMCQP